MRVSIHRGLSGQAAAAPAMGNAMLVVTGAEFLLSMVEARWAARNGDGRKMDAGHKSQQELQKIEQQLKKVQSLDGQDESTRREIQLLQERIELLRKQMSSHFGAWKKPNWRGTRSGRMRSTTSSAFFPIGAKFTAIAATPMMLPFSAAWRVFTA